MSARSLMSLVVGAVGAVACGVDINPPADRSSGSVSSCGRPFEYHGCAVVDLNGFSDPIDIPTGQLTHATCQAACEGNQIVAIFADSCRCGNDSGTIKATDPSVCDNPCLGDPSLGMCGSQCAQNRMDVSTIYIAIEETPVELEPTVPPVAPVIDPVPSLPPTESPPQSVTVLSDPPAQPQVTELPPPPPPAAPEEPLSKVVVPESEPSFTTQTLEPSSVPADPEKTTPGDKQDKPSPTPSVVQAAACTKQFNSWSMAGGLLFFLLVVL